MSPMLKPERPPCNICIKPCCSFIVCAHIVRVFSCGNCCSLFWPHMSSCFLLPPVSCRFCCVDGRLPPLYICVFLFHTTDASNLCELWQASCLVCVHTPEWGVDASVSLLLLLREVFFVPKGICSYQQQHLPHPPLSPFVGQVYVFQIT